MSSQQFQITSLQTLRRFLNQQLVLPECEHAPSDIDADELPEPDSLAALSSLFNRGGIVQTEGSMPNAQGRWFISTVDAGAALKQLPGISLKPNYCLITYLYRIKQANLNHGNAVTWAMADSLSTTAHLEAALTKAGDHTIPPFPDGALANFMTAIKGDLTATSFLTASILQRELQEFGRCGQFYRWHHHRLIGKVPRQRQWQWRIKAPETLAPRVHKTTNGKITVEFYTCRIAPPVRIFRHIDHYPANSYAAKISNQPIAVVTTTQS